MSDILAQLKAAHGQVAAAPVARTPILTTNIDPERWEDLVSKFLEAQEGFTVNMNAITAAGMNAAGQPVVLAALKRDKRHPKGGAHVTVYSSGAVTWTNVDPIDADGNSVTIRN